MIKDTDYWLRMVLVLISPTQHSFRQPPASANVLSGDREVSFQITLDNDFTVFLPDLAI